MKRGPSHSPNSRSKLSKYDIGIDKIIIEILDDCNFSRKSGEVKDQVEKILGRTISPDTYSAHLSNLVKERILIKDDKGRGKEIFYSLSEYGNKLEIKTFKDRQEERDISGDIHKPVFL